MDLTVGIGNILSGIGALVLFIGYFAITIKNDEKSGVILSGVGSFIMCFAFGILGSTAFLTLNIIWTLISLHGYLNRNTAEKEKREIKPIKHANLSIYLFLAIPGAIFVAQGNHDAVSWFSIAIMLFTYYLFASKRMGRIDYIIFSIVALLLSVSHMYDIQNYSSLVQTAVTVIISVWAIYQSKNESKKPICSD